MIYFILILAVTPGMREYIDQYGKIWSFLCEVQDREELPEVCRKNGTKMALYESLLTIPLVELA